ncbi:4160_t:CDS:2 [Diversispora eburnea]|uniref:4160_t:CDS:1 n=1 Tax=Diversispora eburnea TaxID=1213867 RepID=A0A9N8V0H1_9GLOM|nr:4160_t:CDS:2 [Diversispora eburnea]
MSHRREPSASVKETLDASITETNDGERCLNNYILKDEIGHGAYGTVILAIDKETGTKYAIKEFSKSRLRKKDKANYFRRPPRGGLRGARGRGGGILSNQSLNDPLYLIRSEVAVLKKLHHKNVVTLFEVLDDPENDSLYMVFEMCEKGVLMDVSINKITNPFSDENCRRYFREMVLGFEYYIKPDNLLLSNDDVLKIVDFGVSEIFTRGNDLMKKSAGSPAFMPPELCAADHGHISGKAADIWSMGVTLYCLAFDVDPKLIDLLYKILEKKPENRITMPEIRVNPWLTNDGKEPLISTEENCSEMVTEITDDDLSSAIKPISIKGVFAVVGRKIGAVNKFKRLSRSSHSASESDLAKLKAIGDSEISEILENSV